MMLGAEQAPAPFRIDTVITVGWLPYPAAFAEPRTSVILSCWRASGS